MMYFYMQKIIRKNEINNKRSAITTKRTKGFSKFLPEKKQ